jgi:hypothetical protein
MSEEFQASHVLKRLNTLWRVKMTQIEMMKRRGYKITPTDEEILEIGKTSNLFWKYLVIKVPEMIGTKGRKGSQTCNTAALWDFLSQTYESIQDPQGNKNLVIFLPPPLNKSFSSIKFGKMIEDVKKDPTIRHVDVIYEFKMSKQMRAKLASTNRMTADWTYSDLQIAPVKCSHIRDNFEVITPEDFAKEYGDYAAQARAGLPSICKDDPLAKYFQWTPDMVIRTEQVIDVGVAVNLVLLDYIVTHDTILSVDTADQAPV